MNNGSKVLFLGGIKPRMEDFEKLGFAFDYYNENLFFIKQIPDSWMITNKNNQMVIVDSQKRERVVCKNNELVLVPFYKIYSVSNSEYTEYEVCFGNNFQKLKSFGTVSVSKKATSDEIMAMRIVLEKIIQNAINYADENYPLWQDPLAYWNEVEYVKTKKPER